MFVAKLQSLKKTASAPNSPMILALEPVEAMLGVLVRPLLRLVVGMKVVSPQLPTGRCL